MLSCGIESIAFLSSFFGMKDALSSEPDESSSLPEMGALLENVAAEELAILSDLESEGAAGGRWYVNAGGETVVAAGVMAERREYEEASVITYQIVISSFVSSCCFSMFKRILIVGLITFHKCVQSCPMLRCMLMLYGGPCALSINLSCNYSWRTASAGLN